MVKLVATNNKSLIQGVYKKRNANRCPKGNG